jgi:hypothetical protein
MDPATRTIRLAAYLMSRGFPVGDLGAGLDDRVLQALSGVTPFGRAEVEACLALGDRSVPLLLERLGAATVPAPPPPAAAVPPAPAPVSAPSAPAPAPEAPPAAPPVEVDEELQAEVAAFLTSNAKFKSQLRGLPPRVAENDRAYGDMLVTYYSSREAKELVGIRPAVLLARFVELWMIPELRPRARAEYCLDRVFEAGEVP